jgi:hypothetical protein
VRSLNCACNVVPGETDGPAPRQGAQDLFQSEHRQVVHNLVGVPAGVENGPLNLPLGALATKLGTKLVMVQHGELLICFSLPVSILDN